MDARQIERDAWCPCPAGSFDRRGATGLLGEAVDLRQAEPGALADFLGGEERLEDAAEDLRRDADAGVP